MISIVIPYPPSLNTYWRNVNGRTLLSKKGREYKKTVGHAVLAAGASKKLKGRLSVQITLHPTDRRKRDIDNSCKAVLDALQSAGVYLDDSQVDRLLVIRAEVEKGGVAIVTIKNMSDK